MVSCLCTGEFEQADNYANLAIKHDRYNAKALVNKGNCLVINDDLERAKELFLVRGIVPVAT